MPHTRHIVAFVLGLAAIRVTAASEADLLLKEVGLMPTSIAPTECGATALVAGWRSSGTPLLRVEARRASRARNPSLSGKRFAYRAENAGEWGAQLMVTGPDKKPRSILRGPDVMHLIVVRDTLYVFMGLQHLSLDYGEVHAIDAFDTNPVPRRVTLLPTAPLSVTPQLDPNWFLIASNRAVLSLRADWNLFEVYTINQFWLEEPTSAILYGSDVIVGLCSGAAVVHLPSHSNAVTTTESVATVRYFASRPNNPTERTREP